MRAAPVADGDVSKTNSLPSSPKADDDVPRARGHSRSEGNILEPVNHMTTTNSDVTEETPKLPPKKLSTSSIPIELGFEGGEDSV